MRVAIIAGYGELPVMSAKSLKEENNYVIVIAIRESCNRIGELKKYADNLYIFSAGQVGHMFKTFEKEKITHALLIGKVEINLLEQGIRLDLQALWLLAKIRIRSTDTISAMAVKTLANKGITALSQRDVLQEYILGENNFSNRKPSADILKDISLGYKVAKSIGKIDLGQSVVAGNGKILAIESAEGTDLTFARGCRLAPGKSIGIKVAKPAQDNRFDLPTVGLDTLKNIASNGGIGLAFEANETIVIDIDTCTKFANDNNLIFLAVKY